jgi:hypothetical protein
VFCTAQYKLDKDHLQYRRFASNAEASGYTYGNLRLYPIIAKDSFKRKHADVGRYTTLKKALQEKKVVITEKNSGEVNNLVVENLSRDTVIINCGEVIKGGKQDRVINQDMVIYPRSGKKNLPVFCVEQGRWSSRNDANGRQDFKGYYNVSSMGLRKVVDKEKDQSRVWKKVGEINEVNKTVNNTGTYTKLEESKEYRDNLNAYIGFFRNRIMNEKDIVGVIVVSGNKVLGADIFATGNLFKSNFENLLYSYASEAILHGKPVQIEQSTVDSYMKELLDEKKQDQVLKSKGSKLEAKGKKLKISAYD